MTQRPLEKLSPNTISSILGQALSPADLQECLQQSQYLTPKVGKFWYGTTSQAGIYIVISGKARLLNTEEELIGTIEPTNTFGEFTLFPECHLHKYDARASLNLELCFIPAATLTNLFSSYPQIKQQLWQKAQTRDDLQIKTTKVSIENELDQSPAWSVSPSELSALPQSSSTQIGKAYFPAPIVAAQHFWQRIVHRYPVFIQQSTSDCGAACLVMVSQYWGKKFSLNKVRDLANVDRSGASLRGLIIAAESMGFSTRPIKVTSDQLVQQPLPAIVHWEGKHYVVVYEITRREVVIVDPGIGQLSLSHLEFQEKWTGYTLIVTPTALFKEAIEKITPFWQFFDLMKPYRGVMTEVFVASILIQIFGLITPIFTQLILDRVVVQRSEVTLFAVGWGLLIFGVFKVIITGLRQYLLDHTANKIDLALIVGFINHTLRLPLNFFESRYVGDIISRVEENRKIRRFLSGESLSIFLDLLTVFIYIGLMFFYSWQLACLVLLIIPPFFLLAIVSTPFLRRISREIFGAVAKESSYLIEILSGIRTVKSTAVEQTVRWHWEELLNEEVEKIFSGQVISNRLQIFSSLIESLMTTAMLWLGAWLVIQGQLTIGQLIAMNMLLVNIISPFKRMVMLWNSYQEVVIAIERISDVLDTEAEENNQYSRQSLPPIAGEICFENVTFRYHSESDYNILENLSFTIQPGQMVALVGRSGSGKTTISKLVMGLYPPTDGKILIDRYDITSIDLRSLRHQVGIVDQDTFLFGGTIRENISLGHPSSSLEEVIEAALLAGADEFIKRLPMGYETITGEGGGLLSGGQRQRVAIARALLGKPKLLIFDEATSHLDAESERMIQNNLGEILQGRTTLVIAHRLSTVRNANLILVLDKGVLIEQGTHDELMKNRGHYYYLNHQQLDAA
jgi:ATP-binding cassette, subfamily B, bacterial HlyB/CyaB